MSTGIRSLFFAAALWLSQPVAVASDTPRNVILMVADGGGESVWVTTRLFTGQPLAVDDPSWARSWVATYALRPVNRPIEGSAGLLQDPSVIYTPARAWDSAPCEGEASGYPYYFQGYKWLRQTAPDSANTMTAMTSGVRTYPGAINVDGNGAPVDTIAHAAKRAGKMVGVLTSVPWTHATPAAAAGGHHVSRAAYTALCGDILSNGLIDVLGGTGHPWYGADGTRRTEPKFEYVSESAWKKLESHEPFGAAAVRWTVIEDPAEMASLDAANAKLPVLMQARNGKTLQQERPAAKDVKQSRPGEDPPLTGVPRLSEMTNAAMRVLGAHEAGFYLMVEGGAIDWAEHGNQCGRMIEEVTSFDEAIRAVVTTLDANAADDHKPNWSNTLVIVTADHDHVLLGEASTRVPFAPLESRGVGELPGHHWHSNGHSNRLVPLFARGAGAEQLLACADEQDEAELNGAKVGRGAYMQQREIGATLMHILDPGPASPTR